MPLKNVVGRTQEMTLLEITIAAPSLLCFSSFRLILLAFFFLFVSFISAARELIYFVTTSLKSRVILGFVSFCRFRFRGGAIFVLRLINYDARKKTGNSASSAFSFSVVVFRLLQRVAATAVLAAVCLNLSPSLILPSHIAR